ncbi:hypothetical protein Seregon_BL70068 [Xanthomonas phage Seregon]|nr:hypothetical protein Seregon_BL70068 [Xanthomonas phage Seregon]
MKLHSINTEQRVYVMPCGDGFSCYGFDVLDRKARAVQWWLETEAAPGDELRDARRMLDAIGAHAVGTAEHFAACAQMMERGAQFAAQTGKRCPAELVPAFIGREGERVECDYYGERVRFYIGKSTGWMPAHLRIRTRRSSGGEALSASAISNIRFI